MVTDSTKPYATALGVSFLVRYEDSQRRCLISKRTLDWFAAECGIDTRDTEDLEAFAAFQTSIARTASRVISRAPQKNLYVLTANNISESRRPT